MKIACDIDGVLADVRPYLHLIPHNWSKFFEHTLEFDKISSVVRLVDSTMGNGAFVYFVTGRPESNRSLTSLWLQKHFSNLDNGNYTLLMRKDDDYRQTYEIKLELYDEIKPQLIIDDEPKLVMLAAEKGYCVMQVYGYRDGNVLDNVPFKERKDG